MKYKRFKLGLILLGLGMIGVQAQTMYVRQNNGSQTAYALSNVRKLTFSSGNVTVQKTDNSTGIYTLSGLRYFNFTDLTTEISEPTVQLGYSNIIAYPNPVIDVLNIDLTGIIGEGTISILTHDGKVVQEQKTNGASIVTLNLSQLPQGIYLCRYTKEKEIKTVKIIKQ